jgi:hypothetical protein
LEYYLEGKPIKTREILAQKNKIILSQ